MVHNKDFDEQQSKKIYVLDWFQSLKDYFLHLRRTKKLTKEEYASLKDAIEYSETATIIASSPSIQAKMMFLSMYDNNPEVISLLTEKDKDGWDQDYSSPFL